MTEIVLGPDLNADLLELTQHPEQWVEARKYCFMLQGFEQQIGSDHENQFDVGLNYYPRLKDRGFFSDLKALGMPFSIETPGLKDWDTQDGGEAVYVLERAISRIREAGGDLSAFTLDDPLAAAFSDFNPPKSIDQAAAVIVKVLKAGERLGVMGGITEAYPTCNPEQIIEVFGKVQQAGFSPRHLYIDLDLQHALNVKGNQQISRDLKKLFSACRSWTQGDAICNFGVIVNGQRADTPQTYHDEALKFMTRLAAWLGEWPDRIVLESWKKANLPYNLPESDSLSHTGLVLEIAKLLHLGDT